MKFLLENVEDFNFRKEVEINSIEDLKKLQEEYGADDHSLAIDFFCYCGPVIIIFDGTVEH